MNNKSQVELESWFRTYSLCSCIVLIQICLFGVVTNGISAAVYLQPQFRRLSINVLLAALSIIDFMQLLLAIPVFVPGPLSTFYHSEKFTQFLHMIASVYLYPVEMMFHCGSVWLLIVITFERWLAVCRPLLVHVYCTRTRALIAVALVIFLSFLYNLCRFWEYGMKSMYGTVMNLRQNPHYMFYYVSIANAITIFIIPLGFLTTFNTLIALQLRKNSKNHVLVTTVRQRADHRTAKMLIYIVIVFICCYTLQFILNAWESLNPAYFAGEIGLALGDLNNILATTNAATTFLLYTRFSSRFRQGIKLVWAKLFNRSALPEILTKLEPTNTSRRNSLHQQSMIARAACVTSQLLVPLMKELDAEALRRRHCNFARKSYRDSYDYNLIPYRERTRNGKFAFSKDIQEETLV